MHSAKCPMCGHTITADSEEALIKDLQKHAKNVHSQELSEERAKEIAQQNM